MGERVILRVDLLDPGRREAWERAARRNNMKLSAFVRRLVDAAAERRVLTPEAPSSPDQGVRALPVTDVPGFRMGTVAPEPDSEPCRHVVFRVRVLPWGGRVCEGCGDLL